MGLIVIGIGCTMGSTIGFIYYLRIQKRIDYVEEEMKAKFESLNQSMKTAWENNAKIKANNKK